VENYTKVGNSRLALTRFACQLIIENCFRGGRFYTDDWLPFSYFLLDSFVQIVAAR
jgi:hypothetical protein